MSSDIERLIDPDQLRLVLAIVEARSFSGAAAALGISQPSVSQQVKRLEHLSGRRLFRRNARGVELTGDGEALVVYARAMLGLADDLRRHFRQTEGGVKLTLGMAEDFCRTALPSVMSLFILDHPSVEMRIICGTADKLTAAIESKTIDLAVMRREPGYPDAQLLWTDTHAWVGRPNLKLPVADPVPLVVPLAPNALRETLIGALQASGRTWRVAFESFGVAALESAVQAGLGVCAIPSRMPCFGMELLGPASGLPDLPDVEYVMRAPGGAMPGAVAAFAEVLKRCSASSFAADDA